MAGFYCEDCYLLERKCPLVHVCLCGELGLVWEDGWVECQPCARARIIEGRKQQP